MFARLIRFIGVLIAGGVLALLGYCLFMLVYVVTAIAFSGSTGQRHAQFFEGLAPFGLGLALVVMSGWAATLVNAGLAARGWNFKAIALAAVLGGLVSIADPPLARRLVSAPMALGSYLPLQIARAKESERASSNAQALAFVAANSAAMAAAGGTPKVSLASRTETKHGETIEYDVAVEGERTVFAIVKVEQVKGRSKLVLACITPLSLGYRESGKDACAGRPSP